MKRVIGFLVKFLLGLILLSVIIYALGPTPPTPQLNTSLITANSNFLELEKEIIASEKANSNIRIDNEARIIWANPEQKEKTEYAVVYLHGFSASQGEGAPMHTDFAKRYGCNLYLARLADHGIDQEEALLNWTPENFIASAKRAIAIGEQIGEKVIVMGTSTGCTASLYLAGDNPAISALINYSPNIDIADENTWLLTKPWGLKLGQMVNGSDYHSWDPIEGTAHMVTHKYRLEAVVALKTLIDATMTKATFSKIKQPLFMGYWYKNEQVQDGVVSVKRMLEMYDELATPAEMKRKIAFENGTNHVLASPLWNEDFENVKLETYKFAEEILGMKAVTTLVEEAVLEE